MPFSNLTTSNAILAAAVLFSASGVFLLASMQAPAASKQRPGPQVIVVRGQCARLEAPKLVLTDACNGALTSASFPTGRTELNFTTKDSLTVTFSGLGTGQIKPDTDSAIQPVDSVIVAFNGKSGTTKAVGLCRLANPYKGPVKINCFAETADGSYAGDFMTDGSEPSIISK